MLTRKIQVIDCDYIIGSGNGPIIRIFGKDLEGKSCCVYYKGFYPYFYVKTVDGKEKIVAETIIEKFKGIVVNISLEEKYLPIGFQKSPSKVLKVTVNRPAQVKDIRDNIKRINGVEEVYEADILFKYRFLIDHDIWGFSWIEVKGNYVKTTLGKVDYEIEAEEIKPIEENGNAPLKIMSFDIECVPHDLMSLPDPSRDPVVIISLAFHPPFMGSETKVLVAKYVKRANSDIECFENEEEMLRGFIDIIEKYDPDIITGFNILNFDFPYVIKRLKSLNISRKFGRAEDKNVTIQNAGENNKVSVLGRVVVDVRALVKADFHLKRYTLEHVAEKLINEGKLDVDYKDIPRLWAGKSGDINKLIDYARKDAVLPLKILLEKRLLDKYFELSKVSGLLLQDVISGGQSSRVEGLLLRYGKKRNLIIPCKPSQEEIKKRSAEREKLGLKGAIVLDPKVGLYHGNHMVLVLDFRCHPKGTKVIVKGRGEVDISEVKEGDYVLGIDGWHKVRKVHVYSYKGYLINVNGLLCTPRHKLPIYYKWGYLKDRFAETLANGVVKSGFIIRNPIQYRCRDENSNLWLLSEFVGIVLAEGNLLRRDVKYWSSERNNYRISKQYRITISISSNETEVLDRILKISKRLWNYKPYIRSKDNGSCYDIIFSRKKIYKDVIGILNTIENKAIPEAVLRGFFEGDGSINLERKTIQISQSTANEEKIKLICKLLDKVGIKYYLWKGNPPSLRRSSKNGRYSLDIHGKKNLINFLINVDFISETKKKLLSRIIAERRMHAKENYILEKPVTKVKYYEGYVYDLTLEGRPYYFANGILSHNSLYPSLIMAYNICFTTLLKNCEEVKKYVEAPTGAKFVTKDIKEGLFPEILKDLMNFRVAVKKAMKAEEDPEKKRQLDAKQLALKIMMNSFYGYTGYLRARVYSLDVANAITALGRYTIEFTRKIIEEKYDLETIYGDTDSVLIKINTSSLEEAAEIGERISKEISRLLPQPMLLEFEKIYRSFLLLSKKRYAGWMFEKTQNGKWKDKIDTKGIETVRREWCDLVGEVVEKVINMLLKQPDVNLVVNYVRDVLQKLKQGKIPIEKLIMTRTLSKSPKAYKAKQPHAYLALKLAKRSPGSAPTIGERIPFVIVKGKGLIAERAEDPKYVQENNLEIDANYYIEKQLLPPIERILKPLGITRQELLTIGKQRELTKFVGFEEKAEIKPIESTSISKAILEEVVCPHCKNTLSFKDAEKRFCPHCFSEIDPKQLLENALDAEIYKLFSTFLTQPLICMNCKSSFRRPPLSGKCPKCGSDNLVVQVDSLSFKEKIKTFEHVVNEEGLTLPKRSLKILKTYSIIP
ncbi:MAG: DNA polymerase domain-containing protein [Candidatus Baldrarchaeia archaeon]